MIKGEHDLMTTDKRSSHGSAVPCPFLGIIVLSRTLEAKKTNDASRVVLSSFYFV